MITCVCVRTCGRRCFSHTLLFINNNIMKNVNTVPSSDPITTNLQITFRTHITHSHLAFRLATWESVGPDLRQV